jgi:carboxymethylenebutenolidase
MPSFWENLRFAGDRDFDDLHGYQGLDMVAYVSHPPPSEGTSWPAVVVVQEAFGVNEHIQKVCDRFAANGYVAIAPAVFHREHPNPKLGYTEADMNVAINQYMAALRDDELVADINVTVSFIQKEYHRTMGQKVGIVGYCVGGRITYLAATSCPGLSAASAYYPGRVLVPFGDDNPAPIDLTENIKIPLMGNFGADDANPSPEDVAAIEARVQAAGITYDFKSYPGAGHGFNCDERGSYNEAAAEDAWARTLGWFDQHLKN